MHPYLEHVNPYLGKRLVEVGLDKQYVRGEGCYLFDEKGKSYLDFIASYGALPFGFNPPAIWKAVMEVRDSGEPAFCQPSLLQAPGELAARLSELAPSGMQYTTFTNSGAEAVEAAIKLARACTGRRGILSTINGFHGKTLGALSATGKPSYQEPFGAPVAGFSFVPYGDEEALREILSAEGEQFAAFLVEPIQGEGGIIEPPPGYLAAVKRLCAEAGVLVVFDEIQTGLGRTGTMFACEYEGVTPDILLLAKALGGGIAPIGAVMCQAHVYTEEFGLKHSSTFAGHALGCRVALAVLELLSKDDGKLVSEVRRKGNILRQGLLQIQANYPDILQEVRGRGLMLGLDFGDSRDLYPQSFLGVMAEQEILTPMIASFLLNTEGLRVAPTLNGASVIRVEPPLIVDEHQIGEALASLERAVAMLAHRNTAAFLGHLVDFQVTPEKRSPIATVKQETSPAHKEADGRFAFLVHPIDLQNYSDFDKSLQVFGERELAGLSERWTDIVDPFLVSSTFITGATGKTAIGDFIGLPRTAEQLMSMPRERMLDEITSAVQMAEERGADIVGLGAYTSVVTAGGRSLLGKVSLPITTGNSYTVATGVEALAEAARILGVGVHKAKAAVVGAGGAIGKASAVLLAEKVHELVLIGNPENAEKSQHRMLKVAAEILRHLTHYVRDGRVFPAGTIGDYVSTLENLPDTKASLGSWLQVAKDILATNCPIKSSVDLAAELPGADLILVATSHTGAIITSGMLKWGALVCDMSRPSNVSREVLDRRADVLVIDGGVIEVPGRPSLGWDFGFEQGLAYACMSETMILALEQIHENTSIGADLNLGHIRRVRELAAVHGFSVAGLRSFDRPLSEQAWRQLQRARRRRRVAERGA